MTLGLIDFGMPRAHYDPHTAHFDGGDGADHLGRRPVAEPYRDTGRYHADTARRASGLWHFSLECCFDIPCARLWHARIGARHQGRGPTGALGCVAVAVIGDVSHQDQRRASRLGDREQRVGLSVDAGRLYDHDLRGQLAQRRVDGEL